MTAPGGAAIVGAAETTELGVIPHLSEIGLAADAALNALADAGLRPGDVDGLACVGNFRPQALAHYLGLAPRWVDGTSVGGCSFLMHVRHAAAALAAGHCDVALIVHGESGRSRVAAAPRPAEPGSLPGQFEAPFGPFGPPTLFPLPVLRWMKTYGVTEEEIAAVSVVQREWASRNPRALHRDPVTVDDVLGSRMIAYPFRILQCCVVTDGGGALVMTRADRAKDFPERPVYLLGSGEGVEAQMISQMEDYTTSRAFRVAGGEAFRSAGIAHADVDHLMIYDAFAHLPLFGLEDLGFVPRGEAARFIAGRNTAPGGRLPLNTNGGGLSYTHTGMYGMFAILESVRQVRGTAAAQAGEVKVSVCHGVGGMFAASATLVLGAEAAT